MRRSRAAAILFNIVLACFMLAATFGPAAQVQAASVPAVETMPATLVTTTAAMLNARVVNNGGSSIIERRFSWGTTPSASDGWTSAVGVSGDYFSFYLTGLNSGTTYYFQSWAKNSTDWGQGSALSFTTTASLLAAPTLNGPANGATGVSTTPTFTWSAVSGATSYRIMVGTTSSGLPTDPTANTGSNLVINATPTGTSYTPASGVLSAGMTYYWEVHARSPTQYGTWSSKFSFATASPPALPSPPTHVAPSNGATGQSTTPTFQWSSVSDADYYGLYIRDITSGEGPIVFDSEVNYGPISGTSFNLPSGYLSNGKTYRWNMRSHNSAGWGTSFSTGWTFSTQPPPESLTKPTPISPGEALGSAHTPIPYTSITFTWNKNNTGATYALYVRDITGYADDVGTNVGTLVINGLNVGDTNSYVWVGAGAGKKHRWQVEAIKSGVTALSDRLVFTTEDVPTGSTADAFDYPVGTPRSQGGDGRVTQAIDGDGWYNAQEFRVYNSDYSGLHPGEDWNGERGGSSDVDAPVYSVANGVVTAMTSNVPGNGIAIRHTLPGGESVYSVYIHIAVTPDLDIGATVSQGEQIGTIADITSSGLLPHLHFELRTKAVNSSDWYPNDLGNGYYASIEALEADGFTVDPSDFIDSHRGIAPQITAVDPAQPEAQLTRQPFSIIGSGFASGLEVILKSPDGNEWVIPRSDNPNISVTSDRIDIEAGFYVSGTWQAWVTNPGDIKSNVFSFEVVALPGSVPWGLDNTLVSLIEQHAAEYYNAGWNISLSQFKAWIALISLREAGFGRYTAHSQYGGGFDGDRFDHVDEGNAFRFSTGIGSFQLDRGGDQGNASEDWSTMPTMAKLDPQYSLLSVLRWHRDRFGTGATLADFSGSSAWLAVQDSKETEFASTWVQITGNSWDASKNQKVNVAFNPPTISDPIEDSVRYLGQLYWHIPPRWDGYLNTWRITARSWDGVAVSEYFYTYNDNNGWEVWVFDDVEQKLIYYFERNYGSTQYPENRSDTGGQVALAGGTTSTPILPILTSLPIAKPVITSPVKITPIKAAYSFGETLTAEFTITNKGSASITFDELVVGGRNPNGEVVDFQKAFNVSLAPGASYNYTGTLVLPNKTGIYHFFCAYHTVEHLPGEDENNWNTNIDVEVDGQNLVDFGEARSYRERDIAVFEIIISPTPQSQDWQEITGPWNQQISGQRINLSEIAVQSDDPRIIYAAVSYRDGDWGGWGDDLYKSVDGGQGWQLASQGLPGHTLSERHKPIGAIAIAPSDPNVVYLGTTDFNPYSSLVVVGKGVYKSIDGGAEWTQVDGPQLGGWWQKLWDKLLGVKSYHPISSIAVNPTNPDIVYVGTIGSGIWKTVNGGASWEQMWHRDIPGKNCDVNVIAVSPANPSVVYGAIYYYPPENLYGSGLAWEYLLVKSTDGGNTFSELPHPEELEVIQHKIDDIAVDSEDADIVFVINESYKVYRSTDGGTNWFEASGTNGGNPLPFVEPVLGAWSHSYGKTGSIRIHPDLLLVSGQWGLEYVYYSSNHGNDWFTVGDLKNHHVQQLELASTSGAYSLYAAGIEGLYRIDIPTVQQLVAITVTPQNTEVALGYKKQFTAIGTFSDNSTSDLTAKVNWSSSNTNVARINASGLATGYSEGSTIITATLGSISGNATLTITPAVLESIIITPVNPIIAFVSGNPPAIQFNATAVYSNGATGIVTGISNWVSSDTGVAHIDANTGLATTEASGTSTIGASYNGKTGNTTLTVLADTVPPKVILSNPTKGMTINSINLAVSGKVDDLSASVYMIVNSGTPIPLTIDPGGYFSKNVSLNTGSNTILVIAIDESGNVGTSGTITVTVKPNLPSVEITQPASNLLTNNGSLMVVGTVSGQGDSLFLSLNGVSQSVNLIGETFSANVTLAEGLNVLVAYAYSAGHVGDINYLGTSGVRIVSLDTTPPVITIDRPTLGAVMSAPGCDVSGTVNDPGVSTVNMTLNGVSQFISVVGGTFSQKITLASGNNTITFMATDDVGNTALASVTVKYDNTKPEVTVTSPANGLVTNVDSLTVEGTVDDPTINTATLYLNGTPQAISVSSGSFSKNATLVPGSNTLEVKASDTASPPNTGTSGVINVTLDNTAPKITIGLSDPADSISITLASNEALTTAPTVSVNSSVTVAMTQIEVNKWRGTYGNESSPIASGRYTVSANATDKAGNTATKRAAFCTVAVTITDNATATVQTDTATVQFSTTANVTDASVSVTQHLENPSGNVGNPEGAENAAGAFVEIVVSPELRDNLEQVYIRVNYDPAELAASTDESTLKLYLWDVASGIWQLLPDSGVNTTEHYIYGTVTHLSIYGGFGTATVTPPAPTGGGGGGGGGGGPTGCVTYVSDYVTSEGEFKRIVTAKTYDSKVVLTINKGVVGKTKYDNPLSAIIIAEIEEPPAPPEDSSIIGLAYDLSPDGATFDPPITLTITYDPDEIPARFEEEDLVIAIWDEDAGEWVELDGCTVDLVTHTITAPLSHFTQFAVIAKLPPPPPPVPAAPAPAPVPASFAVSDLLVTPNEVKPAEQVTISAVVTNTGGREGSYTVVLKINGVEEARKEVTLRAGKSETVTFTTTKDTEGSYTVDIDGTVGQFTVIVPPPPTPTPEEALPVQPPTNWWLIGGIIAGCIALAVGLLVYFFVWRKRGAPQPS